MSYTSPVMHLCDCRCPVHHGYQRLTCNDEGCACAITCATQPMTLLAEHWGCALFLDTAGDIWTVGLLASSQWEWEQAGEIDSRSEFYHPALAIERKLREIAQILNESIA